MGTGGEVKIYWYKLYKGWSERKLSDIYSCVFIVKIYSQGLKETSDLFNTSTSTGLEPLCLLLPISHQKILHRLFRSLIFYSTLVYGLVIAIITAINQISVADLADVKRKKNGILLGLIE